MREESNKKGKVFAWFHFNLGWVLLFRLLCFLSACSALLVHLQLSWSKSLVRKWFNVKSKAQDFHADYDASQGDVTAAFY